MLDEVMADFPGGYRPYQAVRRLPGTGPVPAAIAVAGIGGVSRFPGPGHLCSRAGLTPRHRESDLKVARGHITRQGPPVLRWAVTEAIQHQPAGSPPRELKDRITGRRGKEAKNIAKTAAARKLPSGSAEPVVSSLGSGAGIAAGLIANLSPGMNHPLRAYH